MRTVHSAAGRIERCAATCHKPPRANRPGIAQTRLGLGSALGCCVALSLSAWWLPSCTGAQSRRGTLHADGRGPGGARTFTDSDVVTGVASTRTDVFVATLRGILRYQPDGRAEPTRFTTAQGLPDDRVYAISVSPDGITWAATARGAARLMGDRWLTAGGTQPDVGRPTALLALGNGQVLLGGAQGLARFDGSRWLRLSDAYQVMAIEPNPSGGALVATAQTGVVALNENFNAAEEYGSSSGIPDALARSVVGVGGGRFWALVQGPSGSHLAYFDGHRWYGYTHDAVRTPWVTLVPVRNGAGAALVAREGLYEIVASGGAALAATDAGQPDQRRRVELHPEGVDAPPPLPGGAAAATSARGGGARGADAGAADMTIHEPPARPRNIPGFAPPAEVPTPGGGAQPVQAPRFALAPLAGVSPEASASDAAGAFVDATGAIFVAREGRGVARVAGGPPADFRARDLAMTRRPLSLATDGRGGVWLVTDQGGAVRFDGRRFARASIDANAEIVPLVFWSRGAVAAAIARSGTNNLVAYRFADNAWQSVTTRRIDPGTPAGTVDARFLAVDEQNRFWVGLRVVEPNGTAHDRGVVLIDGNLPTPTYFRAPPGGATRRGGRARGGRNVVPAPDDVASIDFDGRGVAWLAGVSGATTIGPGRTPRERFVVHTYGEAQGVRGDLVSDLVRGPAGNIWLVTPEGLGYHDGTRFTFGVEGAAAMPPATALAADNNGALWAVGPRGAWTYDGTRFRRLGPSDGIPAGALADIAVDGENRVWVTDGEAITIVDRSGASSSSESSGGEGGGGESGAGSGGSESNSLSGL